MSDIIPDVINKSTLFSTIGMQYSRYGRLTTTDAKVIQAAEMAEADPFIRRLRPGFQTLRCEQASHLSQGRRQRVAIARALLADLAILIL